MIYKTVIYCCCDDSLLLWF